MTRISLFASLSAVALLVSCGGGEAGANDGADANLMAGNGSAAADGLTDGSGGAVVAGACKPGDRTFPGSGLCMAQAEKLVPASTMDAPEGCSWTIEQLTLPMDEYILYRSAKCGNKTTTLDFAGGAHMAEITILDSTVEGAAGQKVAEIFGTPDDGDVKKLVLFHAREVSPKDAADCEVRSGTEFGYPAGSWVVDMPKADRAKQPADEPPVGACGDYGYPGDATAYWKVIGDGLWWINLGQDFWGFDAATLTAYKKPGA